MEQEVDNKITEATGVLMLDTITPIIKAIFACNELGELDPENGQVVIAERADLEQPSRRRRGQPPPCFFPIWE
jgi:hypothetical protein